MEGGGWRMWGEGGQPISVAEARSINYRSAVTSSWPRQPQQRCSALCYPQGAVQDRSMSRPHTSDFTSLSSSEAGTVIKSDFSVEHKLNEV